MKKTEPRIATVVNLAALAPETQDTLRQLSEDPEVEQVVMLVSFGYLPDSFFHYSDKLRSHDKKKTKKDIPDTQIVDTVSQARRKVRGTDFPVLPRRETMKNCTSHLRICANKVLTNLSPLLHAIYIAGLIQHGHHALQGPQCCSYRHQHCRRHWSIGFLRAPPEESPGHR